MVSHHGRVSDSEVGELEYYYTPDHAIMISMFYIYRRQQSQVWGG
jgi:hypothetical protein